MLAEELFDGLERVRDKAILVEGPKDEIALRALGFTNIFTIKGPLYALAELIAQHTDEIVLLTDLDKEGKKLYGELHKHLTRQGVKVDNKLRELLFRTEVSHIEGLPKYLEKINSNY